MLDRCAALLVGARTKARRREDPCELPSEPLKYVLLRLARGAAASTHQPLPEIQRTGTARQIEYLHALRRQPRLGTSSASAASTYARPLGPRSPRAVPRTEDPAQRTGGVRPRAEDR